jgi:hypothetical protein
MVSVGRRRACALSRLIVVPLQFCSNKAGDRRCGKQAPVNIARWEPGRQEATDGRQKSLPGAFPGPGVVDPMRIEFLQESVYWV